MKKKYKINNLEKKQNENFKKFEKNIYKKKIQEKKNSSQPQMSLFSYVGIVC